MLDSIVSFALRFRGVVVALACLLFGYGLYATQHAKYDVFPNFVPPQVTIQAEAPGFAPEQVEALVTLPLENTVNGIAGMESLRSESIQGISVLTVVFKEGSDILASRQMLAEKLGELSGKLPAGVKAPAMSPLTSATMDLLKIGLVSDKLTPMELRTLADWTVKPRLLSVPGVARCIVFGGEERRLQISVDLKKLYASELSLPDVLNAGRAAGGASGIGYIETKNQRIVLQAGEKSLTPESLAAVSITSRTGNNVRIGDVATVAYAPAPKYGDALVQGRPGVLMATASQYDSNTLEVTHELEAALDELKPMLAKQGVELFPGLHRPASFVENSLHNISRSLLTGAILVTVVLLLFIGNIRIALISLTAIPLSLLTAIIALDAFGVTINTLTLGGLAIAIGEVVDDAIIDAENIFHRLRDNRALENPRPVLQVIYDASIEVRSAVVYATFIVVLVFVPVLTLSGIQGKFFAPLAISYILAILASLGVALTLTPALSYLFFNKGVSSHREPRVQSFLKGRYSRLVRFASGHPKSVFAATLLLCAGSCFMLPKTGGELLPEFLEGHFVVQLNTAPGTSLTEMTRIGKNVSAELLKIPEIATVEQQAGRAEQGEDTFGPHRCEFHIELKPGDDTDQAAVRERIRATLAGFPGTQSEVLTFLGDRIGETITGETSPVVINLFGEDLDRLDAYAAKVEKALKGVPGNTDVRVKAPAGEPRLAITLRPDRLARYGFRPQEALDFLAASRQGTVVNQTFDGTRVADVAVVLDGASGATPESVGALMMRSPDGVRVPLSELADIRPVSGRYSILHEGARRRQTVTCNATGVDIATFTAKAREAVSKTVAFEPGYYATFGGTADAKAQGERQLLLHSAMAGVGILILLAVVMRNARNTVLVLANLPFAIIGGIVSLWIAARFASPLEAEEGGLNIGSLVGFVTLFGITTRNSIMMISHFDHLVCVRKLPWNLETAALGASERLIPILMTALVTGIGLIPLAAGGDTAGSEIEGPMAIVILGGLVTSTALNLLVLPTLALRFGKFEKPPAISCD